MSSSSSMPRNAHQRSSREMRIPTTPVHRKRERSVAALSELDEIEDFLEQFADFASTVTPRQRAPDLVPQAQGTGQRGGAGEADRFDGYGVIPRRRARGRKTGRPRQQLVQGEDPAAEGIGIALEAEQAADEAG